MPDVNGVYRFGAPVVLPGLFCAIGQVKVAGLWHQDLPPFSRWRSSKPAHNQTWQTTHVPDPHTGRF